ncbi:MAG: hypothetical protein QXO55_04035 [Candidatus Korarchaeum sp.]
MQNLDPEEVAESHGGICSRGKEGDGHVKGCRSRIVSSRSSRG